jgi:cobalt/nickel transport system permease protein
MADIDRSAAELREMDELEAMDSPIHRLHPLVKLLTTIAYIAVVVSFHKYDLAGTAAMVLYPALLFSLSGIPVRTCFRKLRFVLPLVLAVGLFNPFLDKAPLLRIGNVAVSGGTVSMVTLMLKGVFCLSASFLLAATTPIDRLCAALRKLRVPAMIVTMILLTYRYIFVMIDEASVMSTAYKLRAPGQKGVQRSAWGSFLGQLLLRSMDRANELYSGMQLRGFSGGFEYAAAGRLRSGDLLFFAVSLALILAFRFTNVTGALGGLILR